MPLRWVDAWVRAGWLSASKDSAIRDAASPTVWRPVYAQRPEAVRDQADVSLAIAPAARQSPPMFEAQPCGFGHPEFDADEAAFEDKVRKVTPAPELGAEK